MCIIVYKKEGIKMPSNSIFKKCFESNPDGAGFMFPHNGKVCIKKGFMTFENFKKSLNKCVKKFGEKKPYVFHFRISTQAGTRPDCTHPFPLDKDIDNLRVLDCITDMGVAHNGVISLTSNSYVKTITYNDTMEFISEYLSLIVKDENYYKNADTLELIKKLCGSKLAILDGSGHCELIGDGWVHDGDICYSNNSYKEVTYYHYDYNYGYKKTSKTYGYNEYLEDFYDEESKSYIFDPDDCPRVASNCYSYCQCCQNYEYCFGYSENPKEILGDEYDETCDEDYGGIEKGNCESCEKL